MYKTTNRIHRKSLFMLISTEILHYFLAPAVYSNTLLGCYEKQAVLDHMLDFTESCCCWCLDSRISDFVNETKTTIIRIGLARILIPGFSDSAFSPVSYQIDATLLKIANLSSLQFQSSTCEKFLADTEIRLIVRFAINSKLVKYTMLSQSIFRFRQCIAFK